MLDSPPAPDSDFSIYHHYHHGLIRQVKAFICKSMYQSYMERCIAEDEILAYILDILELKRILLVLMSPLHFDWRKPSLVVILLNSAKCYVVLIMFKAIYSGE